MDVLNNLVGFITAISVVVIGSIMLIPLAIFVQPMIARGLEHGGVGARLVITIPIALYGVIAVSVFLYGLLTAGGALSNLSPASQPAPYEDPMAPEPAPEEFPPFEP
jgi:hypothetical protein